MPRKPGLSATATVSLAVCTPLLQRDCAAAGYMRMFLQSLSQKHLLSLDVVVEEDLRGYEDSNSGVNLISTRQFRWLMEHGNYDEVVYCMGNGAEYAYSHELLSYYRGILWLHEVRLTDLYRSKFARLGRDLTFLPPELVPWTRRYPVYESNLLERDVLTQHDQSIYLTGEVVRYAQKVIVGSTFSKELVEVDSGTAVPVVRIPVGAPQDGELPTDSWESIAAGRGLPESSSVILCEGEITPQSCPETIIDAFTDVAHVSDRLVLCFLGRCEPDYQHQLASRAADLAIDDRVMFVVDASDSETAGWVAAAAIGVHLRYPSDGELPWRAVRGLAAGAPTVVSDHGPLGELPDEAAMKLPTPITRDSLSQAFHTLLNDEEQVRRLRCGARAFAETIWLDLVTDRFLVEVLGGS